MLQCLNLRLAFLTAARLQWGVWWPVLRSARCLTELSFPTRMKRPETSGFLGSSPNSVSSQDEPGRFKFTLTWSRLRQVKRPGRRGSARSLARRVKCGAGRPAGQGTRSPIAQGVRERRVRQRCGPGEASKAWPLPRPAGVTLTVAMRQARKPEAWQHKRPQRAGRGYWSFKLAGPLTDLGCWRLNTVTYSGLAWRKSDYGCLPWPWPAPDLYRAFQLMTRITALRVHLADHDRSSFPLPAEPYRWRPCGVTWDSSRTVVVVKLRRTSALPSLLSQALSPAWGPRPNAPLHPCHLWPLRLYSSWVQVGSLHLQSGVPSTVIWDPSPRVSPPSWYAIAPVHRDLHPPETQTDLSGPSTYDHSSRASPAMCQRPAACHKWRGEICWHSAGDSARPRMRCFGCAGARPSRWRVMVSWLALTRTTYSWWAFLIFKFIERRCQDNLLLNSWVCGSLPATTGH